MKKLMFAFACAATVAAFADGNNIGFEGMISGTTGLGTKNDSGQTGGPNYFSYERASGSTDGSIVKAYGQPDNLPTFDYTKLLPAAFVEDQANTQYLELSTEGGTLWRNFTTSGAVGDETAGGFEGELLLGDAVSLNELALEGETVYVDTLVQFTPTEDGTAPTVTAQDQMAIWLNVDSTGDNADAPKTNLCVLACQLSGSSCDPLVTTFKVPNAAEGGIDVVPGKWYRLTVKAINDISTTGSGFPAFMVYLDGNLIKTDTPSMDAEAAETYDGYLTVDSEDIAHGSVFPSLWMAAEGQDPFTPTFTAVGFKGSGAIDDLVLSTAEPNIFGQVSTLDFTLTWDAGVSAVTYTLGDGAATVPTGFTAGQAGQATISEVAPGTVVAVNATAAAWLEATVTGAGAINAAGQTVAVTTDLAATPAAAGAEGLDGIATADAKAWADAKGITPADITACNFAKNAYLMNTDLSAAPGLTITAIEETEGGWNITVQGVQGEGTVTLDGINGTLKVKTAATLAGLASAESAAYTVTTNQDGTATIKVTGDNTNFMKATVE